MQKDLDVKVLGVQFPLHSLWMCWLRGRGDTHLVPTHNLPIYSSPPRAFRNFPNTKGCSQNSISHFLLEICRTLKKGSPSRQIDLRMWNINFPSEEKSTLEIDGHVLWQYVPSTLKKRTPLEDRIRTECAAHALCQRRYLGAGRLLSSFRPDSCLIELLLFATIRGRKPSWSGPHLSRWFV